MRTLQRNKQKMQYALYLAEAPIYNYYEDDEGNKYHLETGEYALAYTTPVEFFANVSMSGSYAEATEYGLSTADYQAVIELDKGAIPIEEGSLIWFKSDVEYLYDGEKIEVEVNGETVLTKAPKPTSADYKVIKISDSLNYTKAILKAVNK